MSKKNNGSLARISPGQPRNIMELQAEARQYYGTGRKMEGIGAVCDCILLLSAGIKQMFDRNAELVTRVEELEKRAGIKDPLEPPTQADIDKMPINKT